MPSTIFFSFLFPAGFVVPVFPGVCASTHATTHPVMKPCDVSDGAEIITQGDSGDLFYVMTSGKAYVVVNGNQVMEHQMHVAMLYAAPFWRSVLCSSPSFSNRLTACSVRRSSLVGRISSITILSPFLSSSFLSSLFKPTNPNLNRPPARCTCTTGRRLLGSSRSCTRPLGPPPSRPTGTAASSLWTCAGDRRVAC